MEDVMMMMMDYGGEVVVPPFLTVHAQQTKKFSRQRARCQRFPLKTNM